MSGWRLFMTSESGFCQRSLRRYGAGGHDRCPISGYHNASVVIDSQFLAGKGAEEGIFPGQEMKADPRWPKTCACGYTFHPEDNWQVNVDRLLAGAPDGKLYIRKELPPGAVWRATWMEEISPNQYAGPDGKVWCVMMPCGIEWIVYGPASNGRWTIDGTLPEIYVTGSIDTGRYHGYIKAGVISEDCEGRKFEGLVRTA